MPYECVIAEQSLKQTHHIQMERNIVKNEGTKLENRPLGWMVPLNLKEYLFGHIVFPELNVGPKKLTSKTYIWAF